MKKKVVVLPGDGIGQEVSREAVKILKIVGEKFRTEFDLTNYLIGGASLEAYGVPIKDEVLTDCQRADAVLLGAVGGPQWDNNPKELRPEIALLRLRKELGLFTNLRPVKLFPPLIGASTLKSEVIEGIDLLVVRELTGGIYFGQPKFTESLGQEERAVDTMEYRTSEIERIAKVAFEAARQRKKKVTSVDKANILVTSQLWRKTVTRVAQEYPDVRLEHLLVDNCAMQLVRNPKQFDVILTENMFGDILSDEAAMLTGSIGMLPSA
ncbi:MAG: 3-isopropylmalate dehydrogenase, partial [candidate division KSB1 bacterium]|nr:3-isopropylmalate dehydrogenase [candidate division KSB1 bacterium]